MSLAHQFSENKKFYPEEGVFFQQGITRSTSFEKDYFSLRTKENRIYPDTLVSSLPNVPATHPARREWLMRSSSLTKLVAYLKKQNRCGPVLEVGCGNGWLSHHLAVSLDASVYALDINEKELAQGARVFRESQNLAFIYADIFTADFSPIKFKTIVLASCIQYFADLRMLLERLLSLLQPHGEIHIIDSPLYTPATVDAARERSRTYFATIGFPEMINGYHHHTRPEIESFHPAFLFKPQAIGSIIARKLLRSTHSVFPWIRLQRR
jgi:ubiquinone/menaquinone biosynthesis C-methylase UbiE